ncbi:phosphoglycerate mutase family protein [Lysobacter sp. TY2-98]|uniref:SixA phosphatase family protein n=1 Tax=Lysobacter sp. TY2-98 TaxID=2290922 RepID=UPI0013B450CC|nr:phosphoglycerate mutase family protein [Lysobacter sp. TY2-98]
MRSLFLRLAALSMLAVLGACATTHGDDAIPGATFVLVRHAEKADDNARDPSLSPAGQKRAEKLAKRLRDTPLVAIYASNFRRTQQTAAPVAASQHLTVTTYDAARPAADFAAELRRKYMTGTVLVVGHSNTIPPLAQALCGCDIGPTADSEYGRRITIHVLNDGRATVDDRREP